MARGASTMPTAVSRSGRSTYDRALAGIRLLREQQVPFHVISVLSEAGLSAAPELLEFYVNEGIEDVCFNVEESEGEHVSRTLCRRVTRRRASARFLGEFWQLARDFREGPLHPRTRRHAAARIPARSGRELRNVQVEPFGMVNVDCHGNVSSFSPELLG